MSPLVIGRLRATLYLAFWLGVGALLSEFLVLLQPRPIAHAVAFVLPLTIVYQFVCLSAWWVCRSHPLGSRRPFPLVLYLLGATSQSTALWVGLGALWAAVLSRFAHIGPDPTGILRDLVVLGVAGALLYGQSLAVHYFLLA